MQTDAQVRRPCQGRRSSQSSGNTSSQSGNQECPHNSVPKHKWLALAKCQGKGQRHNRAAQLPAAITLSKSATVLMFLSTLTCFFYLTTVYFKRKESPSEQCRASSVVQGRSRCGHGARAGQQYECSERH